MWKKNENMLFNSNKHHNTWILKRSEETNISYISKCKYTRNSLCDIDKMDFWLKRIIYYLNQA